MKISDRTQRRIEEAVHKSEQADALTGAPPEIYGSHSLVPITFFNANASAMPSFGVAAITDAKASDPHNEAFGEPIIKTNQTNAALFSISYVANGSIPVASNGFGQGFVSGWAKVRYDGDAPVCGDELGPVPGQWFLKKGYPGIFTVHGVVDATSKIASGWLHPIEYLWCKISTALHSCGEADALVLIPDAAGSPCAMQWTVTLTDPHDTVQGSKLAVEGQIPAGTHVFARVVRTSESSRCVLEAIAFGSGECCNPTSSGSSASSSSQSSGSSGSSGCSGSASQSGSGSGSGPSASGSEPSGPSGSGVSGSDKSTAIVPASWSPTGYTALFIAECPEVRFDDVMTVMVDKADMTFPIDARFVEVCQRGSIEVCGCVPDVPILVGAKAEGEKVRISLAAGHRSPTNPVRVVVRLTGIRKGFLGHRFPDRTRGQFEANERFIRSAYPDELCLRFQ
jgi:hypothetical protein